LKKAMVVWTLGMKNKQTVSLLKDLVLKKPLKVKVMCNVQQVTGDHTVNLKEILNVSLILLGQIYTFALWMCIKDDSSSINVNNES
jgi:hypothetical protein